MWKNVTRLTKRECGHNRTAYTGGGDSIDHGTWVVVQFLKFAWQGCYLPYCS